MRRLRTIEEATECTAVRLTDRRQRGKVGDLFRLSPIPGIVLWGRVIRQGSFFGVDGKFNLVYIYDAVSSEMPPTEILSPDNLIIGPLVVNNLGFSRGYWEIISSQPLLDADTLREHVFIRFKGHGGRENYDHVDEAGATIARTHSVEDSKLAQSGFGNFNSVDWQIRNILEERGTLV